MKVIFGSATKIDENIANILKCCNKFTLCHIKPNIYMYKIKLASHKQYLLSLLTSRNTRKTQIVQSIPHFFNLSEKKRPTNLEKWQQQKHFSPVCMLLVQLASMNFSYSM